MKRNGKELIAKAMKHEKIDEIPWVPFAGVHAGYLKGYTASEILKDKNKLVDALLEVNEKYRPDGQPIVFDLQLEAEILGCDLLWADNSPPSVASHPLASNDEIPAKNITKDDGRIPIVLEACRAMKKEVGDHTSLYGLFCGPFTLASHLRGSQLFMDMVKNPDYVKKLIDYTLKLAIQMADIYIEEDMDVIVPVDPLISQIAPKHFEKYCSEAYSALFEHIRSKGKFSAFFVCGNAIKNIEVMCKTKPDCISVDENIDMIRAKEITDKYNVTIGGNLPLTTVMLYGNQQDNMKAAIDLIDSIDTFKGFILSPGCDMPYDVPVANGIAVTQTAHDADTVRKLLVNYEKQDITEGIEVELPDYDNLRKPLIELFTLDPIACAACTYMLVAVVETKKELGDDDFNWGDYRYNKIEDIARMAKVGVKNLPSIYLNGKLVYDSIIPNKEELIERIMEVKKG